MDSTHETSGRCLVAETINDLHKQLTTLIAQGYGKCLWRPVSMADYTQRLEIAPPRIHISPRSTNEKQT